MMTLTQILTLILNNILKIFWVNCMTSWFIWMVFQLFLASNLILPMLRFTILYTINTQEIPQDYHIKYWHTTFCRTFFSIHVCFIDFVGLFCGTSIGSCFITLIFHIYTDTHSKKKKLNMFLDKYVEACSKMPKYM